MDGKPHPPQHFLEDHKLLRDVLVAEKWQWMLLVVAFPSIFPAQETVENQVSFTAIESWARNAEMNKQGIGELTCCA